MKYESSILKRLIDTYGVIGNPRYLSEIIKEFIVRGKELYPQLFTYQSDWLAHIDEFGLTPDYVVSYTGQQIYAPNTLERPVKRAILTGQTLVNLVGEKREYITVNAKTLYGWEFMLPYNLTSGKTYLAIFDVSGTIDESNSKVYLMDNDFDSSTGNTTSTVPTFSLGHNVVKCIATNDKHKVLRIRTTYNEYEKFTVSNVMLIEYQDGMENWDISYFEGMQSVKMPVLKTVGKNLFDGYLEKGWSSTDGSLIDMDRTRTNLIFVEKNETYTVSRNKKTTLKIDEFDGNSNFIKTTTYQTANVTLTTSAQTKYIRALIAEPLDEVANHGLQLEKGTQATSYEPYKSNILTVNEPVELRGIGDVQDTLDCLTGEVTERIGEVILDGSEAWAFDVSGQLSNTNRFYTKNVIVDDAKFSPSNTLNDVGLIDLPTGTGGKDNEHICIVGGKVYIRKNKTECSDLSTFENWLSSNPIKVQYELATESIKTVDLTIHDKDQQKVERLTSFEGGTHFSTSSQGGSLQPTIIVDVVTDLEETLNLCSTDGNTM